MPSRFQPGRSAAVSLAAHAALALLLLGGWHFGRRPVVVVTRPGDASGTRLTLTYSPGGAPPAPATAVKAEKATPPVPSRPAPAAISAPALAKSTPSAPGSGSSGESSLGNGDLTIAYVRTHPRPAPDLSSLPHGASGDVILDVTIDEQGRITTATLAHGLGGSIDQTVLAVVQGQWTFTPATRNGVPVASEQEVLFHYERS